MKSSRNPPHTHTHPIHTHTHTHTHIQTNITPSTHKPSHLFPLTPPHPLLSSAVLKPFLHNFPTKKISRTGQPFHTKGAICCSHFPVWNLSRNLWLLSNLFFQRADRRGEKRSVCVHIWGEWWWSSFLGRAYCWCCFFWFSGFQCSLTTQAGWREKIDTTLSRGRLRFVGGGRFSESQADRITSMGMVSINDTKIPDDNFIDI